MAKLLKCCFLVESLSIAKCGLKWKNPTKISLGLAFLPLQLRPVIRLHLFAELQVPLNFTHGVTLRLVPLMY
jgi:hypothetical protein